MNHSVFRALAALMHVVNMCQPFRAFVSVWVIVCMLFATVPLGCHSVKLQHANGQSGQPHIPQVTAERLQECVELLQDTIEPGRYAVDAHVELDKDGRILDVTTKGAPNPDVGMCMRIALRDMAVRPEVIDEAGLRPVPWALSNAEAMPNRAHIGEVVTVTVVVIVFVDVIIDAALVALGVTVTATVAAGAVKAVQANAAQTNSKPARKPHQPVREKWEKNGGTVRDNADGTRTYTRSDGVAVTYDKAGFPDFTPYRHPAVRDVQIEFSGSLEKDFARADTAAGITEKMRQKEFYSWHHHQDGTTMQLIRRDVHEQFFHTGGMSRTR